MANLLLMTGGNVLLVSGGNVLLVGEGSASVSPAVIARSFALPAPAMAGNGTAAPATIALSFGVPNPATSGGGATTVSPARIALNFLLPHPSTFAIGTDWQVVVEQNGSILGAIETAVPGPYSVRTGFEFGEFEFTCSTFDAGLIAHLPYGDDMISYEIALYENGELRWIGRPAPWTARLRNQEVIIRSRTFEYDFERRFFGWAERINLMENGSFETFTAGTSSPPDNWAINGTCTAARVAAIAEGTYAVQLTGTGTSDYLYQQEATGVDIEFYPGLLTVATAWGKITSGTVEEGQVLARLIVDGAPGTFTADFVADESMTAGHLFRMSTELLVTAGINWTGELRLYAMNGVIVWDDAEIVFDDATTVLQNGGAGEDLARLVENVTEYAQTGDGWSNLYIAHDCPDTGTLVLRGWEHQNHEWIADAYRTLIDEYGVDIWVGLDRILHLRNKRGTRRPELTVNIDIDTAATLDVFDGYEVNGDPSQGTNVAIVTGESHLFAADEAGAQDTTKFGGLSLAKWERAPVSFQPLDLSHRATEIITKEGAAPALPNLLVSLDDGIVECGDVIPVTIDFGWVQVSGDYRVTMVSTDPFTRVQTCTVDIFDGILDSD